jgi:hypothetical protein
MKANNLFQILLGGLLAIQICVKSAAQPTVNVTVSSSDFTVIGDEENKQEASSTLPNFSASGSATSPLDQSSASGAQTISFGGGIFAGAGRIDVRAGQSNGKVTEIAAGETSVFILFTITNSFHYQFVSSVSADLNVNGFVTFNGLGNSNGQVTASGTLVSNQYQLRAFTSSGSNDVNGSGTWSYSLSLVPANIPAGRLTAAQKAADFSAASAERIYANQLFNAAGQAPNEALLDGLMFAYIITDNLANNFEAQFLDPLDTNYTVIPEALAPAVTPLAAGGTVTQAEANLYNAWLTNLSQAAGYSTALTTCINRAQGAAFAGNSFWDTAQMNTAVQYEAQLAFLMDQEPALRSNVLAQFVSDGFPAITVTTNDAIDLQNEIATNGLPAALQNGFTDLRTDSQTISNIEVSLLTSDPNTMAGGFPASLANTNLDLAAQAVAASLRDASLVLINTAVLTGGQFRFDLPTEPGYTYTIQFSQDLADPAIWTTIFSNNATASLLSFTNTPPVSAQAGFYRALHN